ncbi:TadE/TadG family type IV pilus assembly protein [Parvularcula dongshanensis]|uniref:TadE-like domain-containing protein n=1 Tax=Parvularcula dongshanensis TaxID=1173995 RepID=A0A840I5E4_9PROT|nr:TadE family protein [Parvularcula dongshanensis]MBB4660069.1 hypothetical protein [Parvularcula dongshanensis]
MRVLKNFARKTDGVTAIESVFIIPVFFALVFSTFEVGYVFFTTAMVEQSTSINARRVKVGRAFKPGLQYNAEPGECQTGMECFFDSICSGLIITSNCDNLAVEVRRFDSFADIPNDEMNCRDDEGFKFDEQLYEPGDKNDIIRVRVCYNLQTVNPTVGLNLAQNDDGTRSIIAVQIMRNEPFLSAKELNPNLVDEEN